METSFEPHHDGSAPYVASPAKALGDTTTVKLRVPHAWKITRVAVRYVLDGEPSAATATLAEATEADQWWAATFRVANPTTPYRWLVDDGVTGFAWVNATGTHKHDPGDADDYLAVVGSPAPAWHAEGVVYQIFPDRFARSGIVDLPTPAWAVDRQWDSLPTGRGPATGRELYRGDLHGVTEHLDHVAELGATAVYLTPVFPAESNHRYNASSFDHVDPILGGDAALAGLTAKAHAREIRVIADITLNHVGDAHPWFTQAQREPESPERGFFWFGRTHTHGYASWFNVRTLPKLNHASAELTRRLFDGPGSIVQRYLRPPYSVDGWRVDVANMAGRFRDVDLGPQVARAMRDAVEEASDDAVVIAEHCHDYRSDVRGGNWHGAMNYTGFTRAVWMWLRADALPDELETSFFGMPAGLPRRDGVTTVRTMRQFAAGVPWDVQRNSWSLLDSHDSARFLTVVGGSRERHTVGVGMQMTFPGVPMVFAGDEIGLEGAWGEDARRTMPWDARASWDAGILATYRRLIALRRGSPALRAGGMRFVHASPDAIAYLREGAEERVLCLATRQPTSAIHVLFASLGCQSLTTLEGLDPTPDGAGVSLPATGPAFHAWRLNP